MLMQTGAPGAVVSLKSYSKDIPPGWKPRAYPIKEYEQNIKIWARLTTLDSTKWGAAVMSRLDGQALKVAQDMHVTRYDTDLEVNALSMVSMRCPCQNVLLESAAMVQNIRTRTLAS